MSNDELMGLRQKIDEVDEKIQRLINERAGYAVQVAKAKKTQEDNPIFYRPEREAQVLKKVMARNESMGGVLPADKMARLF
ncbi:MAG: chorismate mutase, partial [Moraxella sp.]